MQTVEELREEIHQRGITIRQYAEEKKIDYHLVTQLLSRKISGNYGRGHEAAVKMGLKRGVT